MYIRRESAVKGTFPVRLANESDDSEIEISVYPPKISVLRKINELDIADKDNEFDIIDSMIEILSMALSSNKEKIQVSCEYLENVLDDEDIQYIFEDFFNWAAEIKKK